MSVPWHQLDIPDVCENLRTTLSKGLTEEEVLERRISHGENVLEEAHQKSIFGKIIDQFKSPLVFVLLGAGVLTTLLHEYVDALVIAIALIINVVVGTIQEERANKAFEKLKNSQEPHALVIRNGKKLDVKAEELVPGDVVLLEGGFSVPADIRIVEAKDLEINESVLTGEWLAVTKQITPVPSDVALAERTDMAWMGTLITSGFGKGVVVETGPKTQVGQIAHELASIEESETPLQRKIRGVARFLTAVIGIAIALIFILGLVRQEPLVEMLLISVAVAVATIPSGLPAAVTIVLALGMEAILKRGGLVRNLRAAETLGSTTVILTDKTGTLTQARMKVGEIHTYGTLGTLDEKREWSEDDRFLLQSSLLVSDAFVEESKDDSEQFTVHGNPVERAITLAGLDIGLVATELEHTFTRADYLPFSSERRFAAALSQVAGKHDHRLFVNGAPEVLLEGATHVYKEGRKVKFPETLKEEFRKQMSLRSQEGVRLIACAYKDVAWSELPAKDEFDEIPRDLVFVGFMGLADPLRDDVIESIAEVKEAGARVIMITGDNPETAGAIARSAGILVGAGLVVRGDELDAVEDEQLYDMLMNDITVIARAAPKQKLRIARILKDRGEVVAMTGDGINDAPALRAASIGVAVGSGTEVAKEASDLVLINNSFTIIVAAIEEGRRIIDNLKKIIAYLLATSFSEIFVIGGALIVGVPLPLLPAQILWANIVEEGLMSFAFAFEKKDPNAMKRSPRSSVAKNILTYELKLLIFVVSVVTGFLLIALYFFLLSLNLPIEEIRTIMFVALSLDAIFFSFSLKSLDTPVWKINPFSNKYLLAALCTSMALLFGALAFPPLQRLLTLVPLNAFEIILLVLVGLFNLITIEVCKYLLFERVKKESR